jgi:hypothetical protein
MGNHDDGYLPDRFGNVVLKRSYSLEHRLLISHRHDFDEIMFHYQWYKKTFSESNKHRKRFINVNEDNYGRLETHQRIQL